MVKKFAVFINVKPQVLEPQTPAALCFAGKIERFTKSNVSFTRMKPHVCLSTMFRFVAHFKHQQQLLVQKSIKYAK